MKSAAIALLLVAASLCLEACASGTARGEVPPNAAATAAAGGGSRRSIGSWVSCSGKGDDSAGVAKAFAAAGRGAFTLVVDCPVRIGIGMDITRSIFIDTGTTVEFEGAGKFVVDNVFIPAFVIADSSGIRLTNWNVEYDGGLPIEVNTGGYVSEGQFVRGQKPGNAFNDIRLTRWLAANRGVVFEKTQGNVNAQWTGTTNACGVFFISGDSSDITVRGMHLYVPPGVGGEKFIPVAFSIGVNFRPNQVVTAKTPLTAQYFAVPHGLHFSDVTLDGTYMGWVGGLQDAVFENIHSLRYGDLQDGSGANVGGMRKWFAPPHLFYFSYTLDGDPGLFNTDIQIRDVVDEGVRSGKARDEAGASPLSGYAPSLKIGCVNCSVDRYRSDRPDGVLDVLASDGLTVSNVTASYDSSFLNNIFPGWRFPSGAYKNVVFRDVVLIDHAASSVQLPIGNANNAGNQRIVMKNVKVELNRWAGPSRFPLPAISAKDDDVSLTYELKSEATQIAFSRKGAVEVTLQAASASAHEQGAAAVLVWIARGASRCTSSGAWSGEVAATGTREMSLAAGGAHQLTLECTDGSDTSRATVTVPASR